MAAKIGKLSNIATDPVQPDVASGYPSQVIPGVINPVMFDRPTVPDHLLTVSEAGDYPQPLCQPEPEPEKPVGQGAAAVDQYDLRPDPTMAEMDAFWADMSAEAQAQIKAVITRYVADRDGDVAAQWLTRPAMLAEMAHLGIQRVLRMASTVSDDESAIASAFADTPDDIRFRVRQRRREQQDTWVRFDQDQRESSGKVTGIDHVALALEPGAAALVDYQLPGGGSLAVPITNNGLGWAVPLTASEVEALPWLSLDEPLLVPFSPVDDVVTSIIDDLAVDWLEPMDGELDFPVYRGSLKTAWADVDPVGIEVDIDLQPFTPPALLATVTDSNRTIAKSDSLLMAMPLRVQSVASAGRGPPIGWRGAIGVCVDDVIRPPSMAQCGQTVARVA